MKTVALTGGESVPAFGVGTWRMGESRGRRKDEVAALKLGLDLGVRLIDTAEMYGSGGSEEVVGEAIAGRREGVFLVSKVMPQNASRKGTVAACEKSLKRLGVAAIDLFLLHWRGSHPLADTVAAFEALRKDGKIRHWGVSNFDTDDMAELWGLGAGPQCQANQVFYNPARRGMEFDLVPWQRRHKVPFMAYSPLDEGRIANHPALAAVGRRHGASAAQVAIAWGLSRPDVMVIPKAADAAHLKANVAAQAIRLDADDMAAIDKAFPPPSSKKPLELA